MITLPGKISSTLSKRKKLGELLLQANLIDSKTLDAALEIQKNQPKKLGQILQEMGVVDEEQIAKALASQLKIPFIRLSDVNISADVIAMIPRDLAENYLLIPVKQVKDQLVIAAANPLELYALDDLRLVTQMNIFMTVASRHDVLAAIHKHYPLQELAEALGHSDEKKDDQIEILGKLPESSIRIEDLRNRPDLPPVMRFIRTLFTDAIKVNAEEIHIEPQKDNAIVRYKTDGILRDIMQIDKTTFPSLVSQIKILADMDISIRRKPQNGRVQVRSGESVMSLRISTLPAPYGERMMIRISNPDAEGMELGDLGFSEPDRTAFMDALSSSQGVILTTGPAGSGKSAVLYAALKHLKASREKIVTIEDLAEYQMADIHQEEIHSQTGISFASALESILKNHPQCILVGEIPDSETAKLIFQAAHSGCLILTCLPEPDSATAISRLLDLGVDASVLADHLIAVIGQRLVRRICGRCKIADPLTPQIFEQLNSGYQPDRTLKFWKGEGCEDCQYSGYSGRTGIFEIARITPAVREIVWTHRAGGEDTAQAIRKAAVADGFISMKEDGITKAFQGETTIEEVLRMVPPEPDELMPSSRIPAHESSHGENPPPEKAGVPQQEPPSAVSGFRPAKILMVDDNIVILKILKNILESHNFLTVSAANGIEALKMVHQEKPDLIIADYLMPEMDGMTLITRLKAQLSTRFIPIVMLTSKDEVETEVAVINAGADDYLTKPVHPKRLIARINRLLNQSYIIEADEKQAEG